MGSYWADHLVYHLIAFQAILLLTVLSNTWVLRRAGRHPAPAHFPGASILVPARDEGANIERCVRSLLAQDYPDFELLVLDDASTDATRPILESLAGAKPRLRILDGQPLPPGWLGKNWACAQLAAEAAGDLLVFTDADTYHLPGSLRATVSAMAGERADLLSGFPRQEVLTWGEKLIVPFFSWVLHCFTPLSLGYRLKLPALSCAVGQILAFRREAYQAIGGHGAVRSSIVEDLALARRIQAMGYRWRMKQATDLISCRMYRSGREAVAGLTKNLFAAFDFRLAPYLFVWLWLLVLFATPLYGVAAYALGATLHPPLAALLACIGLALVLWIVPYRRLRLPLLPAALYPVTLFVMEGLAWRSLWLSLKGDLTWKGRALIRPRIKGW